MTDKEKFLKNQKIWDSITEARKIALKEANINPDDDNYENLADASGEYSALASYWSSKATRYLREDTKKGLEDEKYWNHTMVNCVLNDLECEYGLNLDEDTRDYLVWSLLDMYEKGFCTALLGEFPIDKADNK